MNLILNDYKKNFKSFKNSAILPVYDFRILFIILKNKKFRPILTPKLIWRLLSYKIFRVIGNLVPFKLHYLIRRIIGV